MGDEVSFRFIFDNLSGSEIPCGTGCEARGFVDSGCTHGARSCKDTVVSRPSL